VGAIYVILGSEQLITLAPPRLSRHHMIANTRRLSIGWLVVPLQQELKSQVWYKLYT